MRPLSPPRWLPSPCFEQRSHHGWCRLHRVAPLRAAARPRRGGVRPRRPVHGLGAERRAPARPAGLPSRRRLGAQVVGRERARASLRRGLPPGGRGRRAPHRRGARAHARDEHPGNGERPRPLQPLRQARAGRVHVGGVRRPSRAGGARRGEPAHVRPDDRPPLGVRGVEGVGRVPGARVPPGARARLRHRAAVQHRGTAAKRSVRHGHPPLRHVRARGPAARDPRRRHADAVLLPRAGHDPRARWADGGDLDLGRDLQRRLHRERHDQSSSHSVC